MLSLSNLSCLLPLESIFPAGMCGPKPLGWLQIDTIHYINFRRMMIEKIASHLADFSPRLQSNTRALYQYCPIPIIGYPQLENELFCNIYYLRHLCDTTKFPDWPIKEPVSQCCTPCPQSNLYLAATFRSRIGFLGKVMVIEVMSVHCQVEPVLELTCITIPPL